MKNDSPTRYEHPELTPVEVPFGFSYESLADTIGRMVAVEHLKTQAKKAYVESFDESQDFGEDPDEFVSKHEMTEMQDEEPTDWYAEQPAGDADAHQSPPAAPNPTSVQPEPPAAAPAAAGGAAPVPPGGTLPV